MDDVSRPLGNNSKKPLCLGFDLDLKLDGLRLDWVAVTSLKGDDARGVFDVIGNIDVDDYVFNWFVCLWQPDPALLVVAKHMD